MVVGWLPENGVLASSPRPKTERQSLDIVRPLADCVLPMADRVRLPADRIRHLADCVRPLAEKTISPFQGLKLL